MAQAKTTQDAVPSGTKSSYAVFLIDDARKAVNSNDGVNNFSHLIKNLALFSAPANKQYAKDVEGLMIYAETSDRSRVDSWSIHNGHFYDNKTGKIAALEEIIEAIGDKVFETAPGKTNPSHWGKFGFANKDRELLKTQVATLLDSPEKNYYYTNHIERPDIKRTDEFKDSINDERFDKRSYVPDPPARFQIKPAAASPAKPTANPASDWSDRPFAEYTVDRSENVTKASLVKFLDAIKGQAGDEPKGYELVVHAAGDFNKTVQSWAVSDGKFYKAGGGGGPVSVDSILATIASYKDDGVFGLRADGNDGHDFFTALKKFGLTGEQIVNGKKNYTPPELQAAVAPDNHNDLSQNAQVAFDAGERRVRIPKASAAEDQAHVKGSLVARVAYLTEPGTDIQAGRQAVPGLTMADTQRMVDAAFKAESVPSGPPELPAAQQTRRVATPAAGG